MGGGGWLARETSQPGKWEGKQGVSVSRRKGSGFSCHTSPAVLEVVMRCSNWRLQETFLGQKAAVGEE